MSILLGAIADDFTGATDLANTLVKEGMRVVQVIGVPDDDFDLGGVDAVVVALKSRTNPAGEAVEQSLAALRWLRARGMQQAFFKYCSTFDSTREGNIGPVADALLDALGGEFTIACPAFPTNGRSVYKGHLFVGDLLLSESSMKDHPLTPMDDANLVRVLGSQTPHSVGLVPHEIVARGPGPTRDAFDVLRDARVRHGIVDAIDDADLRVVGEAAAGLALVTGGSGIALGLPENFRRRGLLDPGTGPALPTARGRAAVLAGSCSVATRGQLAHVSHRWPMFGIDPLRMADGTDVAADALDWALEQQSGTPVVVYSSADPEVVREAQAKLGREEAGAMVEKAMADIARGLVAAGIDRMVVAGGETSGAVVSALGVEALRIGPEIDPGVPWCEAVQEQPLALALKSGNFGGDDFFEKAFGMLTEP
jgi:uncharacterized protein YgbK (DUF1537 family)